MKKQYSSSLVKFLLTNEKWNFWKSDWSERIIVDWGKKIKRELFFKDVRKLLGEDFIYERALNNEPPEYVATKNGLKKCLL